MEWNLTITVNEQAYSLRVVQRVAYAMAATLSIHVKPNGQNIDLEIAPTLIVGGNDSRPSRDQAHELVLRSLNDFAMREQIQSETSGLRELLVNVALRGAES